MAHFGTASLRRLESCDERIQQVMHEVIARLPWWDPVSGKKIEDIIIIEGHRGEDRQNQLVHEGFSRTRWPLSKHNSMPSRAIDVAPYHSSRPHIRWSDIDEMEALSRLIMETAARMGVKLRWGADWDQDGIRVDLDPDESLLDGPHYELVT